ncbi:Zn-ribbon domain-containing OB-fold protein [Nocardioides sp. NPDC101246]|uniref:Zn-ribbon domain-containing OB-fold protein n=1 Tax=Nocardioides sp. NPDC101246 TaxID=3364336 RepID=UPI0037F57B13
MGAETPLGEGRPIKRRAGSAAGGQRVADSRPPLVDGRVVGSRCTECGYPSAQTGLPWCPACQRGEMVEEGFGPDGVVWSSARVQLRVLHREPPYTLAYVDLDDGPRVLARLLEPVVLPPGARVGILGTEDGDLIASTEIAKEPV